MPDFNRGKIEIRFASTDYGPFRFDFTDALPTGATIDSISVTSYLGRIKSTDVPITAETETGSELIDASATEVHGTLEVDVYFNYPTTPAWIGNVIHTLVFTLTLDNGAIHCYYFNDVVVM